MDRKLSPVIARRILVRGRVQGVGYRPFVLRLALEHGVSGWVRNRGGEVEIHAEGSTAQLAQFAVALTAEAPPLAVPEAPDLADAVMEHVAGFSIRDSGGDAGAHVTLPPDHFVCADCLAEMSDPSARRFRYPFTNCTQCGPRYTIIDQLPYDRPNTAMADFPMCADCRSEYDNPLDRRYHAQPLACPACGPTLSFHGKNDPAVTGNAGAIAACVNALRRGAIVAIRGIGGYHLVCDATNSGSVELLRLRKHRPAKPLALMIPERLGADATSLSAIAMADEGGLALLRSPGRPIVLMRKSSCFALSPAIAPGLDEVGLMLPYSPLHHLLLGDFGAPLVATSANLSGEPVLTEAASVMSRLASVADAFLHHDRPIRRPADDPVFRTIGGKPRPLRLGRGNAPIEMRLRRPVARPLLAAGADLKNTVALAVGDRVILSPHLGDLAAPRSLEVFEQVIDDLCRLHGVQPDMILCDAHPDYLSSRWARARGLPLRQVFHHAAHASALHGEAERDGAMLVFTWDGLGFGADGTLWGGEALLGNPGNWRRVASLAPLKLIGGNKASRDAWRCALAACLAAGMAWTAEMPGSDLAAAAWQRDVNCPVSSSAGRLFDAAAALLGLGLTQAHEGDAAMRLEALAAGQGAVVPLPLESDGAVLRADWRPLLPMLMDVRLTPSARAASFHASLAAAIAAQANAVRERHGVSTVGLAGGVFQNRRLTDHAIALLQAAGFAVILPQRLPVNDAAISFGQIVEAQAAMRGTT
jgi:hydrogenase maturation protein HypF